MSELFAPHLPPDVQSSAKLYGNNVISLPKFLAAIQSSECQPYSTQLRKFFTVGRPRLRAPGRSYPIHFV